MKVDSKTRTLTLYNVRELECEHGEAYLYRVEKGGSRAFNGYDSHFIIHSVEETRYTHNCKHEGKDTKTRYHCWRVEDEDADWFNEARDMIETEDIPAPTADSAATKTKYYTY